MSKDEWIIRAQTFINMVKDRMDAYEVIGFSIEDYEEAEALTGDMGELKRRTEHT